MIARLLTAITIVLALAFPLAAQKNVASVSSATLTYADVADLALRAPIVAQVRIRKTDRLKSELAGNVTADQRRYLVTADVSALIRGSGGLPPRITYVLDVGPDTLGRWPKFDKAEMIVFALPVPGRPSQVRLASPNAQQPASADLAAQVRSMLSEANAAGAPPLIKGVGDAFHVAGVVPGEGETQIFLNAADGRPLSLSIWRTPGAVPRWAVSVGEIVDEGAEPPARDTLLWYRLACGLPSRLPASSVDSLAEPDAAIAAEDYATVIAGLGPCHRTLGKQSPGRSS